MLLIRMPRDGVCFLHAQNKRRPLEFCRVLCDLTATPWRSHGVVTASPRRFYNFKNAVGSWWERHHSVTGVLGNIFGFSQQYWSFANY